MEYKRWRDQGENSSRIGSQVQPSGCPESCGESSLRSFRDSRSGSRDSDHDAYLRHYILGLLDSTDEPVSEGPMPLITTTSNKPHYVVFSPAHDPQSAIVNLYGYTFRIELGPGTKLPKPVAIICQINGSGIRLASTDETREIIDGISSVAFTQPWKRPPEIVDR